MVQAESTVTTLQWINSVHLSNFNFQTIFQAEGYHWLSRIIWELEEKNTRIVSPLQRTEPLKGHGGKEKNSNVSREHEKVSCAHEKRFRFFLKRKCRCSQESSLWAWEKNLKRFSCTEDTFYFLIFFLLFAVSSSTVSSAWNLLHKERWTIICSFVRGGSCSSSLPEPYKMAPSRLLVCMVLTRLSETDSMSVARGPDVL